MAEIDPSGHGSAKFPAFAAWFFGSVAAVLRNAASLDCSNPSLPKLLEVVHITFIAATDEIPEAALSEALNVLDAVSANFRVGVDVTEESEDEQE
eukprot:SAG31_NODE_598_length_13651_cov_10.681818_9_plen_95_part_00